MKIDFYFWGCQCPISYETIALLEEFQSDFEINYYDISINPKIASDNNIYFPFLTVIDDDIRWHKPLTRDVLIKIKKGERVSETPYIISHGKEKFFGEIVELNDSNIYLVSKGCTLNNCLVGCSKKGEFLSKLCNNFYGYLHLDNEKVVGGVEYVPSLHVPYNIPKHEKTAFLTCIYHSSSELDYKSYPLEKLELRLSGKYEKIIAISDETGTFPNGNLQWFLDNGYEDEGVISVEKDYCRLHLVSKKLINN